MFHLNDSTAGAQRMAVDNSYNAEIGPATPTHPLTVNGSAIITSSSGLAQSAVAPSAMPRIVGSLTLADGAQTVVSVPATSSAISSVSGNGLIVGYSSDHTQMTVATAVASGSTTLTYGAF